MIIESLPNVKYRVDVTLQVIRGSALVILSNGSEVTMTASTKPSIIELTLTRGLRYIRLTKEGAKAYDELVQWIIRYVGSLRLSRH